MVCSYRHLHKKKMRRYYPQLLINKTTQVAILKIISSLEYCYNVPLRLLLYHSTTDLCFVSQIGNAAINQTYLILPNY